MTIKPMVFNGMMQRSQDVSAVKHQQDQRPVVEQQQIGQQEAKKLDHRMHQVNESEKKDEAGTKYDAREEGKNKYFSSSKKEKKEKNKSDKVVPKNYSGGFDIKI